MIKDILEGLQYDFKGEYIDIAKENSLEGVQRSAQKNREGFQVLDQATGGYAGKIKDLSGSVKGVITGAKGFIKTLRGVKGALISTGIGALVVALERV